MTGFFFLLLIILSFLSFLLLEHVLHLLFGAACNLLALVHSFTKSFFCFVHQLLYGVLHPVEPAGEGADAGAGAGILRGEAALVVVDPPDHESGASKSTNEESFPEVVRHFVESE